MLISNRENKENKLMCEMAPEGKSFVLEGNTSIRYICNKISPCFLSVHDQKAGKSTEKNISRSQVCSLEYIVFTFDNDFTSNYSSKEVLAI